MRPLRIIRRGLLTAVLVLPATVLGWVVALGWSPPGRDFSSRLVQELISDGMAGRMSIRSIDGNLINHVILHQVEIHDSVGASILAASRIEAHYTLLDLYAGRLLFNNITIDSADVHVVRSTADRWNYQDAFRAGKGKGGGPPPWLELTNATLRHVTLRVDVPTVIKEPPALVSRNATPLPPHVIAQGPDGPHRVYHIDNLNAVLPRLRLSTPKDDPILAEIGSLSGDLNDPRIRIEALQGQVITAADSLRFTFARAAMPGTVVKGGGVARWPNDTLLFDFALQAESVDLKDLRWISPDFPDWQGRGNVIAHSLNERRTDYRFEQLRLGDGRASAVGSLTAMVDVRRGLGMRDLQLTLGDVPLAVARPYLDTLPFLGRLNGQLTADGFLDTMRLGGNLVFNDELVAGEPASHFVMNGAIHFGGTQGAVFDGFQLTESSIALGTVQRIVPAVTLQGLLSLQGELNGPWTDVAFKGTTVHLAPSDARSRMVGLVRLDTRDTLLAVDMDVSFDQLSFEALRSGYPRLPSRGGLIGHYAMHGRLDSLTLEGSLTGEIGTFRVGGNLDMATSVLRTDSLLLEFERLDMAALTGKGTTTSLTGNAIARGAMDTIGTPVGAVVIALERSRVGDFRLDGADARLRADNGLMIIDSLSVRLPEGWIDVTGNLGLDSAHAGTLKIDAGFNSLTPFDSLVRAKAALTADTLLPRVLNGTVHGNFTVTGSVDDASVVGTVQARNLVIDQWRAGSIVADIRADSLGQRRIELSVDGDSVGRGTMIVARPRLRLAGRLDSLRFSTDGRLNRAGYAVLGTWNQRDSSGTGTIDTLALNLPTQQWRLMRPLRIAFSEGQPGILDTLMLRTADGLGQITAFGTLPGTRAGNLTFSGTGIEVNEVASMIQRDSAIIGGIASIDLRLSGTADAPLLRGSGSLTGPHFGDTRVPLVRAAFDYVDRRLRSQLTFWKTGDPLMQVDVSVPFDLAFNATGDRKLPGEIAITAIADSADLGLLSAFTTSVESATGTMNLNMRATGSWKAPRLDGMAQIDNGSMVLPDLAVEYTDITARLRFTGDSLAIDTLHMTSDKGTLTAQNTIRFPQLGAPQLNLLVTTDHFLLMDVPGDMTIRSTGTVTLTGPLFKPVLTGNVALSQSTVYYEDLLSKTIVDLSDPAVADLVDTATVRRQGLGANFQSRLIDSLRIDDLRFEVDEEVSLRSSQAIIFLTSEGEVRVQKRGKAYNIAGEFNVERGSYTISFSNVLNKEFRISRGKVRFTGDTTMNANVDLEATHSATSDDTGEQIPVVAHITGTIENPKIELSSPGRSISEVDLVSYLLFGMPAYRVQASPKVAGTLTMAAVTSILSGTLNQSISRYGLSVTGVGALQSGLSYTRQLGSRAFVALNAGYCTSSGRPSIGASAEYSLGGGFRLQSSVAPVLECLQTSTSLGTNIRWQIGSDLLWKRDY